MGEIAQVTVMRVTLMTRFRTPVEQQKAMKMPGGTKEMRGGNMRGPSS